MENITSIKYKRPGDENYTELADVINELYERIAVLEEKTNDES